jgi:hypothetical protein
MGYEVKMYIVQSSCSQNGNFIKFKNTAVEVWGIREEHPYHYNLDHNTKTFVEPDDEIVSKYYSKVIGMVDLCKLSVPSSIKETSKFYFYDLDGNTPVVFDKYGDELKQASLTDVIAWLEEQIELGDTYSRYKTALALAKSCVEDYNNPIVLFFGY